MHLVAQTDLIAVYWLDDIGAGYGIWTGMPHIEPTREALGLARGLLARKSSGLWISNTEQALVSSPETQALIIEWLGSMRRDHGLVAWADLPPKSATAKLVVKNLGASSVVAGVHFAQFADLDAAKAWLRKFVPNSGLSRRRSS